MKAIGRRFPNKMVYCYELMDINRTILSKVPNVEIIGEDFLAQHLYSPINITFDRIIANPPFSKNQDIAHVREMYNKLSDGGKLVSIVSKHWQISNNKTESEFRAWLDEVNATIIDIEKGAFKESGTNVGGLILVIDKKV